MMKNFRCKHKNYELYTALQNFFKKFTAKKGRGRLKTTRLKDFSSVLQDTSRQSQLICNKTLSILSGR